MTLKTLFISTMTIIMEKTVFTNTERMALSLLGKTNKRVSELMETENFVREEFLSWSTICFGLSETWDHKYFALFAINKNLLSTKLPFLKLNRNLKIHYNTSTKKHNINSFLRKCSKFDSTEELLRCVFDDN